MYQTDYKLGKVQKICLILFVIFLALFLIFKNVNFLGSVGAFGFLIAAFVFGFIIAVENIVAFFTDEPMYSLRTLRVASSEMEMFITLFTSVLVFIFLCVVTFILAKKFFEIIIDMAKYILCWLFNC